MSKLPKNWCECKLEDCVEIILGQSPKSETYNDKEEGIPFFQGKADFGTIYPNVRFYCNKPSKIAKNGDILLSIRAPVGAVNISNLNCCIGRGLAALRGKGNIQNNFVYFLIKAYEIILHQQSTGTTFDAITGNALKNINIILPPLEEQGRIVEKIEKLFSDIDNGIKDLKIAQAQIKQYRQSVLKSAFEGKLTDNWRQLHKCEKNMEIKEETGIYKIPHSWLWCKLTAIGTLNRGKSKHRPRNDKKLYGGKYPFIQTGDVKEANMYIHKYSQTYNDFGLSQSKLWNENTLCITIAANIAETAILKIKACFPDSIVGFVKNKYLYSEELVEYYFRTIKGKLEKYAPATAQKNINLSVLNDILFPIPPLPEQQQIVAEIEKRFAVADEMEKAVNDSLLQAEKLKQSILKQAFAGKLVPQNPNDEPAAVLLERIKTAKEKALKEKNK